VAHVSPEAHTGGAIGLIEDGDVIRIDVHQGRIDVKVSDAELNRRRSRWTAPEGWTGGIGEKYARSVGPANLGAPTHSYR
jgi:dihydroxy-acid dehydratase